MPGLNGYIRHEVSGMQPVDDNEVEIPLIYSALLPAAVLRPFCTDLYFTQSLKRYETIVTRCR